MEFEASGHFTIGARLRESFRRNAVFYAVYFGLGLLVLGWLLARGTVTGNLEDWVIAASNAWGLLLLTVLMGSGLVAFPRHLRRVANPRAELKRLYSQAVALDEKRLSKLFELHDVITQVRAEISQRCGDCAAGEDALGAVRQTLRKSEAIHQELSRHSSDARDHSSGVVGALAESTELRPLDVERLGRLHVSLKWAALE